MAKSLCDIGTFPVVPSADFQLQGPLHSRASIKTSWVELWLRSSLGLSPTLPFPRKSFCGGPSSPLDRCLKLGNSIIKTGFWGAALPVHFWAITLWVPSTEPLAGSFPQQAVLILLQGRPLTPCCLRLRVISMALLSQGSE